jgi:hypothetical protein
MADQGSVSKLAGSGIAPLPKQRSLDPQTQPRRVATPGAGRREVPDAASRQWVNIDGKQLNRMAPRGTYVNLLV